MLLPTLWIPLVVGRFMKHMTAHDQCRILNHPVEAGFDATWAGEGDGWNGNENKECIKESHVFLDGNCSSEHRKTQLTLSDDRVYLPYILMANVFAERDTHVHWNRSIPRANRSPCAPLTVARRLASCEASRQTAFTSKSSTVAANSLRSATACGFT